MATRALVTGATGFLGSHLVCTLLDKGYEVLAAKRERSSLALFDSVRTFRNSSSEPSWIDLDLQYGEELERAFATVDAVFHCAAKVSFRRADFDELMETNVLGTRNVVNACLKTQKPLILASSVAAIGRTGSRAPISEDTEYKESKYNTDYAVSKYLAELELWRGVEEGLQASCVNPGIILGYGDGHSGSNQLYRMVKNKIPFMPTGTNGFVGVEDVCRHMLDLYEKQRWGTREICVAETLTYAELFGNIADHLGVRRPPLRLDGLWLKSFFALSTLCAWLRIPFFISRQALHSTHSDSIYQSKHPFFHDLKPEGISEVNRRALKAIFAP